MATSRLESLRKKLKESRIDAFLVSSVDNIAYLTNFSRFSPLEREAFLLITASDNYIITDGRYSEEIKEQIPDFILIERNYKNSWLLILKKLSLKHLTNKLGIEEENLSVKEYKMLVSLFKTIEHFDFREYRSIKSNEEITKIEEACRIGDRTFEFILKKLKKGVSEKEIAFEIEFFIRKQGCEISFPSIVAFGKNSSVPHHIPGEKKLEKPSIVLLDYGVKYQEYCSDMTRAIFLGKPDQQFKKIYNTVLKAQQLSADSVKIGISARKVDKVAREYIISKGFPSIPHGLGHGVGLQIHETPHISVKSKDSLKENMVFSIEPGIYLPNYGGVRIEDLFVLEKNRLRKITKSHNKLIYVD